MHPSERIAPLFARLGSLGELRSASGPTKIRRRSHKLPREGRNLCARNWVGFGRRPNPPASLTGWRPSRGQFRAQKLHTQFMRPSSDFCRFAQRGRLLRFSVISARIFASAKIRRRSQKLRPSRGNFCARNWRTPIPTLRANLASRIAGRFARTDAKILALITL